MCNFGFWGLVTGTGCIAASLREVYCMHSENSLLFFHGTTNTSHLPFLLTAIVGHGSVDAILLLVVFVVASALEAATTMCIMAQPVWMHGCVCKIPRHCVATLSMATPSVTAAFYSRTTSKC